MQIDDAGDDDLLIGMRLQSRATTSIACGSEAISVGSTAQEYALRFEVAHRLARALADGLAFPLRDERQYIEDEAAHRVAGVEGFGDREQVVLLIEEVAVEQRAQVDDGSSEAIQFHDEERVGLAALKQLECGSQSGAVERLRRSLILRQMYELEPARLAVAPDALALRVQADAFLRLQVGADSHVPDYTQGAVLL